MADAVQPVGKDSWSSVSDAATPVLVDFWAPWCGPCKAIGPVLDELASDYAGKVAFYKVNVDEEPEIAQQFQIRSIPTLLIFDGGTVKAQHVGAATKTALQEKIDAALG
jgi:thioredoxin 1